MKKLIPTVLIILCMATLTWAGLRANAAFHFFAAQSIAEPFFKDSQSHINTALRRFPNNPDYLDFAGSLIILQASQPGVVGIERTALLESAAENFRQAISSRPLWPYSWVNLLTTKDKLGQVDMEFNTALSRSAQLGPWEPRVQLQVINSGLRYWGKLGSAEREVVQQKVLDALIMQPRKVFVIVKDYGRPDLVCDVEDTHIQIRRWCETVM